MAICPICNKEIWNNQTKRFSLEYCIGNHISETKEIKYCDCGNKLITDKEIDLKVCRECY